MWPAAGRMAGSGMGAGESITIQLLIGSWRRGGPTSSWLHLNTARRSRRRTDTYS
jgi:hypothetical protein